MHAAQGRIGGELMGLMVKGWEKFQHYKSGRGAPPWIKLYRGLLNDKEWFALDPAAAKFLVSVWILAAETDGVLPDIETIAFRLRADSKTIAKHISDCSHWLIDDDINLLANSYQLATPETETETETDSDVAIKKRASETDPSFGFDAFWLAYPNKKGKGKAIKSWNKISPNADLMSKMLAALEVQKRTDAWTKDGGQFIPHPSTWLNGMRWEDEVSIAGSESSAALTADKILENERREAERRAAAKPTGPTMAEIARQRRAVQSGVTA